MGTSRRERNRRQADYQRAYRAARKAAGIPSRDDVAKVVLHWVINEALARKREADLLKFRGIIVERLVALGFEAEGATWRFDEITDRYDDGWIPQRRRRRRVGD